ncbi:MAG: hypothetical protein CL609_24490 [Anaerolineaceae bacterium]|nr:hypothetical protein [Anaerolineaceae bacterium]
MTTHPFLAISFCFVTGYTNNYDQYYYIFPSVRIKLKFEKKTSWSFKKSKSDFNYKVILITNSVYPKTILNGVLL